MTIRLLCAYDRYPANAIVTLDAGTEAGLIAAKQATATLTGGDAYFVPVQPVQQAQPLVGGGRASIKAGEQVPILLPEGQALTVIGAAGTVGTLVRTDAAGTVQPAIAIGAGSFTTPAHAGTQKFLISCSAGSVDMSVGAAVLGAAIVESTAGAESITLPSGRKNKARPDGSLPMIMIGGDHAFSAWYGTNGRDGMAAWYKKYGLRPYIAICTDPLTGSAPEAPGCMTWHQTGVVQRMGAEMHAHGVKHPALWEQISSGIAVWYLGNDASATGQVTYTNVGAHPVPANVVLVSSSSTDNLTLAVSTYPTLELLAAAITASGKWGCEIDPSLPAGVPSAYLLGHVSAIALTKTAFSAVGFSVGGGALLLRYEDTAYKRVVAYRSYNNNSLVIMGDGVQLASFSVLTQTTLASMVAAINALAITGLTANLCTNGNLSNWTSRSYNSLSGSEASLCIGFFENVELGQRTVSLDSCYMSRSRIIQNQQDVCAATSAANSVPLDGFLQSGAAYFPWTVPGASALPVHRYSPLVASVGPSQGISRNTRQPNAHGHQNINGARVLCYYSGAGTAATIELTAAGLLIGAVTGAANSFSFDLTSGSYDTIKQVLDAVNGVTGWSATSQGLSVQVAPNHDSSSTLTRGLPPLNAKNTSGYNGAQIPASGVTLAREIAMLDALADSRGFYVNRLIHKVIYDGSSGFAGLSTGDVTPAYADCSESALDGTMSYISQLVKAGKLQQVTPLEFTQVRQNAPAPDNLVFNPHFRTSGESLRVDETNGSAVPSSAGARLPGWSINGGYANVTDMTAANGVFSVTTSSTAAVNPINQYIALDEGKEYELGADVEMIGVTASGFARLQLTKTKKNPPLTSPREASTNVFMSRPVYDNQTVVLRFYVGNDADNPLGRVVGNVAEPFNLSANNQIGLNIDTVGTIANINCAAGAASASAVTAAEVAAAINAAIKASGTYPAEFWNCATAVAGRVVITSPYRRATEVAAAVSTSAGTADAQTAIFGSTNNKSYSPNIKPSSASDFPYLLNLSIQAIGTVKISNVYIKEIRENV